MIESTETSTDTATQAVAEMTAQEVVAEASVVTKAEAQTGATTKEKRIAKYPKFDPMPSKPTQTTEERRSYLRSFDFWNPSDLTVYRNDGGAGDDGRANLPLSESVVFSLLANRSPAAKRRVFGHVEPILCVTHSRQPLCGVVWDKGAGLQPWITEGRQRGGDSEQRGAENPGAIEAINRRVAMLVDLSLEIASKDADAAQKPDVLRVKVRAEATTRYKKGEAGWTWAKPIVLPLYFGGSIGATINPGDPPVEYQSLIEWLPCISDDPTRGDPRWISCPKAIPYVAWLAWEPEDRDPGTFATQLASLALKSAQVATPPTRLALQYQSLCADPAPPRLEDESAEDYERRIAPGRPYGQGIPVRFVAELYDADPKWVHFHMTILRLEKEVQEALDAGELSLRQVQNGGFLFSSTGGPGKERLPKDRAEQLRLLEELRGKRGVRHGSIISPSSEEDESNASSSGGRSSGAGSSRREISSEDSAGARHSAEEPRATPGPDSPSTAGVAPKEAKLDWKLFVALRDRFYDKLEALTVGKDGKLPDGREFTAEDKLHESMYEAVYQFAAYLAGDVTAFHPKGVSVVIERWCADTLECVAEVVRGRGLTITETGAAATGVAVLEKKDRAPAELVSTPRKGGEAKALSAKEIVQHMPQEVRAPRVKSAKKSAPQKQAVKKPAVVKATTEPSKNRLKSTADRDALKQKRVGTAVKKVQDAAKPKPAKATAPKPEAKEAPAKAAKPKASKSTGKKSKA